jgi:hypothetical protein
MTSIEVGGFNEKVYASEEIWFGRKLKKLARKRHQKFIILLYQYKPQPERWSGMDLGKYSGSFFQ